MKPLLYLSLLIIAACGVKKTTVDYGTTTKANLVQEMGEPVEKEAIPVKDGEIYKYPDNVKYQIQNDVVAFGFKDPKGDEKTLLYWKHKFKDCVTTTKTTPSSDGHLPSTHELTCAAEGTTVVFMEGSEFVSRIIEHEKK